MLAFLISILPVILIGLFTYKLDKNKEPLKLLIKLFLGGCLSIFLALIIRYTLAELFPILLEEYENLNLIELLFVSFIGIALIEEFSKWITAYIISYNNKEFDELYDMILYCTFVSLGFALIENIMYVSIYGIKVGLLRGILSVPSHACDGIIMGYFLGLSKEYEIKKDKNNKRKYIFLSIIIPTLIHGLYDYFLLSGEIVLIVLFIIFVIVIYIISIKKLKKVSKSNKKIIHEETCPYCGNILKNSVCLGCGYKKIK